MGALRLAVGAQPQMHPRGCFFFWSKAQKRNIIKKEMPVKSKLVSMEPNTTTYRAMYGGSMIVDKGA